MDEKEFMKQIENICNEVAREVVESGRADHAEVHMRLRGDDWIMVFKVSGSSGRVTYETPEFKAGDYDAYIRGKEEEIIDDYINYCANVLEDMAELASNEY